MLDVNSASGCSQAKCPIKDFNFILSNILIPYHLQLKKKIHHSISVHKGKLKYVSNFLLVCFCSHHKECFCCKSITVPLNGGQSSSV